MRLSEVPVGVSVRITSVNLPGVIEGRLLGIGFVPGTIVEVVRSAPLGDPRVYRVRGKLITLRNDEAAFIEVEPVGEIVPLSMARVGGIYRIVSFSGGRGFVSKMRSMGLVEGSTFRLLGKYPLRLDVNGRIVELGMGMGSRIMVEEVRYGDNGRTPG